jgi:hypothetical protein
LSTPSTSRPSTNSLMLARHDPGYAEPAVAVRDDGVTGLPVRLAGIDGAGVVAAR